MPDLPPPPEGDSAPSPRTQLQGCFAGMGMGLACALGGGFLAVLLFNHARNSLGYLLLLAIPCCHWGWTIYRFLKTPLPEGSSYRSGLILGSVLISGLLLLSPLLLCFGLAAWGPR